MIRLFSVFSKYDKKYDKKIWLKKYNIKYDKDFLRISKYDKQKFDKKFVGAKIW